MVISIGTETRKNCPYELSNWQIMKERETDKNLNHKQMSIQKTGRKSAIQHNYNFLILEDGITKIEKVEENVKVNNLREQRK